MSSSSFPSFVRLSPMFAFCVMACGGAGERTDATEGAKKIDPKDDDRFGAVLTSVKGGADGYNATCIIRTGAGTEEIVQIPIDQEVRIKAGTWTLNCASFETPITVTAGVVTKVAMAHLRLGWDRPAVDRFATSVPSLEIEAPNAKGLRVRGSASFPSGTLRAILPEGMSVALTWRIDVQGPNHTTSTFDVVEWPSLTRSAMSAPEEKVLLKDITATYRIKRETPTNASPDWTPCGIDRAVSGPIDERVHFSENGADPERVDARDDVGIVGVVLPKGKTVEASYVRSIGVTSFSGTPTKAIALSPATSFTQELPRIDVGDVELTREDGSVYFVDGVTSIFRKDGASWVPLLDGAACTRPNLANTFPTGGGINVVPGDYKVTIAYRTQAEGAKSQDHYVSLP